MSETVSDAAIGDRLAAYDGWAHHGDWLIKTFEFDDFSAALDFVNEVGDIAEGLEHHPDITIQDYNEVVLRITSHDVGSITARDLEFVDSVEDL